MKQFLITFLFKKRSPSRRAQGSQFILFIIAYEYQIHLIVGNIWIHIFL